MRLAHNISPSMRTHLSFVVFLEAAANYEVKKIQKKKIQEEVGTWAQGTYKER